MSLNSQALKVVPPKAAQNKTRVNLTLIQYSTLRMSANGFHSSVVLGVGNPSQMERLRNTFGSVLKLSLSANSAAQQSIGKTLKNINLLNVSDSYKPGETTKRKSKMKRLKH